MYIGSYKEVEHYISSNLFPKLLAAAELLTLQIYFCALFICKKSYFVQMLG